MPERLPARFTPRRRRPEPILVRGLRPLAIGVAVLVAFAAGTVTVAVLSPSNSTVHHFITAASIAPTALFAPSPTQAPTPGPSQTAPVRSGPAAPAAQPTPVPVVQPASTPAPKPISTPAPAASSTPAPSPTPSPNKICVLNLVCL